jgi:hypothetical protein
MDHSQQHKEALHARFNPKLDAFLRRKKPTLKIDENYAEIVSVAQKWRTLQE